MISEEQCDSNNTYEKVNGETSHSATSRLSANHNLPESRNGDPNQKLSSLHGTYKDVLDPLNGVKDSADSEICGSTLFNKSTVLNNNLDATISSLPKCKNKSKIGNSTIIFNKNRNIDLIEINSFLLNFQQL